MSQKIEWNQHLIALFNGEGFAIVSNEVFFALRARRRQDTNMNSTEAAAFVQRFLTRYSIPQKHGEPLLYRRIPAEQRLSVRLRTYEIWVHVVRVPGDFHPTVQNVAWTDHPLADKLEPSLLDAQNKFQQRDAPIPA